jgi:hypothetical protein
LPAALLWGRSVVCDFTGEIVILVANDTVEMQLAQSASPQFHERLVDRDAREPGIEAGISTKGVQVPKGSQKGILRHFFGIFAVPGNRLREPENARAVSCHEFFESYRIASPGSVHECGVEVLRVPCRCNVLPHYARLIHNDRIVHSACQEHVLTGTPAND